MCFDTSPPPFGAPRSWCRPEPPVINKRLKGWLGCIAIGLVCAVAFMAIWLWDKW